MLFVSGYPERQMKDRTTVYSSVGLTVLTQNWLCPENSASFATLSSSATASTAPSLAGEGDFLAPHCHFETILPTFSLKASVVELLSSLITHYLLPSSTFFL